MNARWILLILISLILTAATPRVTDALKSADGEEVADSDATSAALGRANNLQGEAKAGYDKARKFLPDWSRGEAGAIGPFYWGRAVDAGEDVRFADEHGKAKRDGDYLWFYGYNRLTPKKAKKTGESMLDVGLHARNNLVSRFPRIGYRIQPSHFVLNTTGAHNAKISIGYVPQDYLFYHGDNTDLPHLALCDRVIVYLPVRKNSGHPYEQKNYFISPIYQAQSACVIEFKAGEMIHYEWFGGPKKLHERVLYDLAPHLSDDKQIRPGVTHPIVQFDIHKQGGWTLKIERDGRDGLKGGENKDDFDIVVTHESKGAKPYSVKLDPDKSAWAMTVYSPGGAPADTSEVLIGMQPYDRATGRTTDWPDRDVRVRSTSVKGLPKAIEKAKGDVQRWDVVK